MDSVMGSLAPLPAMCHLINDILTPRETPAFMNTPQVLQKQCVNTSIPCQKGVTMQDSSHSTHQLTTVNGQNQQMDLNQNCYLTATQAGQVKVFTLNYSAAINNWKRLQTRSTEREWTNLKISTSIYFLKTTVQVVFQNKWKRNRIFWSAYK